MANNEELSLFLGLVTLLLLVSGCTLPYTKKSAPILGNLTTENYEKALSSLEKLKKEPFLYYTEKGTILHYAGKWAESNLAFDQAEEVREEFLVSSISRESISLITSDTSRPYPGEDYEDVFINYYKMLNYIFLDNLEEALVEARRVDHKLKVLSDRYEGKTRYKSDAFLRYLTGVLYESQGNSNDAFIAYREAYEIYKTKPKFLIYDLIRTARSSGLDKELEFYTNTCKEEPISPSLEGKGELFFIFENGLIPPKEEESIEVLLPKKEDGGYLLKMAFPAIRERRPTALKARVSVGTGSLETVLMEDLQSIAIKNLEDKRERDLARVIARAALKYGLSEKAKRIGEKTSSEFGQVLGTIVNLFGYASERADLRSWQSLPQEIQVARLPLPEGDHRIEVAIIDSDGVTVKRVEYPLTIKKNKIAFLVYRFWDLDTRFTTEHTEMELSFNDNTKKHYFSVHS